MNNHLTDEQLVDLIEGNSQEHEQQWLKHIHECQSCRESFDEWKRILGSDVQLNEVDRKRVWNGIQEQRQKEESLRERRKKRWVYLGWAASCIMFLMIGYLVGQNGTNQNYANGSHMEEFMNQPVQHFNMVSSDNGEPQGVAWYNPTNRQMILYLNDPQFVNDQSEQVQIQTMQQVIPVQPNHLSNGRMQIYLKDRDLQNLMQLIVNNYEKGEQRYYFQVISD